MPDVRIDVYADTHGAPAKLIETENALKGIGDQGGKSDRTLGGLWKSFAAGIMAVDLAGSAVRACTGFIKDSVGAAIEAEISENNLRAALESTGRAVEPLAGHLLAYSSELQRSTTFEDDAIQGAQALLVQLTDLDEKGLDEATRGAIGLASVMGGGLESATRAVAMAYEGNFTAIGKLIPAVRDAKTESEKYAAMQAGLNQMFARAKAETGTFGGVLKQLGNAWDDVKEGVGGAITKNETIIKLIQDLKKKAEDLVKSGKIEEWAANAAKAIKILVEGVELLGDAVSGLSKGPTGVIEKFLDHFGGMEKKVNDARQACVDFREDLQVLTPSLEELRAESEKGPKSFAAYKARMKELDDQLVANKDTIVGWIEKGTAFLGLNQKLPKPIKDVGDAAKGSKEKIKTLAEQLNITFRSDTEEKVKKLNEALVTYRGKLTADEVQRICGEINALTEKLTALKGPVVDVDQVIQNMLGGLDDTAEAVAAGIADIFKDDCWDQIKQDGQQAIEQDVPGYLRNLPVIAEQATSETKNYFDGLFNDIASGFGNTIQSWLSGATTFRNFLTGLWGDIKNAFFRMIGEMVAKWVIGFVKKIIDSTVDIATSIAKNVGGPISSLADTASRMAGGFLSSLGSLGSIVSGITSVIQLLKGPQKQTDVTYWLKLQWELLQNSYNFYIGALTWKLDAIFKALDNSMKPTLWVISTAAQLSKDYLKSCVDYLKPLGDYMKKTEGYLRKSEDFLKEIAGNTKNLKGLAGAQAGAISTQTELMVVHGTPTDPEFIFRGSQLGAFARAGAAGGTAGSASQPIILENRIYIDGQEMKKFISKTVRNLSRSELLQIHPRAVRAY